MYNNSASKVPAFGGPSYQADRLLPPALNRAKAQHACVLRPPERGGAGCQSLIKTPMTGTPSSTGLPGAPYA